MTLIRRNTSLASLILQEPSVIPVINRFGIRLGVNNATVEQICMAHALDCNFVLALLNTLVNEGYFPENLLMNCGVGEIAGYLAKADNDCRTTLMQNVRAHFARLMTTVTGESNMPMMHSMAGNMLTTLDRALEIELSTVIPALTSSERDEAYRIVAAHAEVMSDCWSEVADLRSMLVNLVNGDMDTNLLYAVIVAVGALEKDLRQNNRLRQRIMLPLLAGQESSSL